MTAVQKESRASLNNAIRRSFLLNPACKDTCYVRVWIKREEKPVRDCLACQCMAKQRSDRMEKLEDVLPCEATKTEERKDFGCKRVTFKGVQRKRKL